jgi:hypothetical protein
MESIYGPDYLPGASDAPLLDNLLGSAPGVPEQIPTFGGGVTSFDWIRLGWLALGIVIGLKVLRP